MRLKISTLLISLFVGLSLQAQKSEISFQIKNAGVFVNGTFDSVQVVQNFNPEELSLARFKAIIPVSTIYTGIKSRDRHLLKAKYFNQENFPEMVFESTEVNASNKGYQLIGNLTIKSTTKSVDIKFSIEREGKKATIKVI